ncbi:MAG: glycosyltransferase family 39 protein [Anaerolineae bacterium]|nr:glycosyltransferase family 39 protein [Anaerolineae bacterium]
MDDSTRTPRWLFAATLLLTLLVAAGLRLYRLQNLPLGFHYDEAANAILAGEIASGAKLPVFIPSYTGKEVLFFYWAALWMKLLGTTPWVLRLSAALTGVTTVAATYWAIREMLYEHRGSKWIALLTSALLATSFWHLVLSRYGFRAVTQPLMQALAVAALWRGLRLGKRGLPWLLLAGLFCGLTAYTYLAARAFPIPLAAAFLALLLAERDRRRARLGQMTLFISVAALTLVPLAHHWWTHPGSFMTRTQQVAATGWNEAWDGIMDCLGMFFIKGDPYIRFNIPFRPIFDPIIAILFLTGVVVLAWRHKSPISSLRPPAAKDPLSLASCAFLLVSLPVMLLPSALAAGEITPSNLRAAGLLPFVYVFPALGLSALQSLVSNLANRKSQITNRPIGQSVSLVILLLAILTPITAAAYFGDWAISPALYYEADGDLADAAAYLNRADLTATTVYVASVHYDHPTLALFAENYSDIHRLTGGRTVVFPAEGKGLLIVPRSTSGDLTWIESVLQDRVLGLAETGYGPDGSTAFHAYRIGPIYQLATTLDDPMPRNQLVANFSHVVQLLGYDVIEQPRSGESVEVAIWWRVLNAPDLDDYRPIARLADPWGSAWGETLPFHYISKEWEPGEIVVDHLSIPIAPGAPPGDYTVRFGFYSASAGQRLAVLDDAGRYGGTYVELPIHLARTAKAADPGDLEIRDRLNVRIGGLTLLGANLDTLAARPGGPVFLTLFWRVEEAGIPDHDVALTLGDATLHAGAPVHDTYPFSAWAAGETVADHYGPRLPRDMPAGEYSLRLQVGDQTIDLGAVNVQATERVFDIPPISHPLAANLGDQVELLGYDLSAETIRPGGTLTLTLYWRALREMDESYTVFTHLVAADGTIVGQKDNPPVGGSYPTNLWLSGEVVVDVYEIPVSAGAASGEHTLEAGLYIAETGARLPVLGESTDAVTLQIVTIKE